MILKRHGFWLRALIFVLAVFHFLFPHRAAAMTAASRPSVRWSCKVPSSLNGPLDDALVEDGAVSDLSVRLCPGDRHRAGLVWVRTPHEDYPRGRYMVSCVLGPGDAAVVHSVPEAGPGSFLDDWFASPSVAYLQGSWRLLFFQKINQFTPTWMIYAARFDEQRCDPPQPVSPPVEKSGQIFGLFSDGSGSHLLWSCYRHLDSPILLLTNRNRLLQVMHARFAEEKADEAKVVWEDTVTSERNYCIVRRATGQFDLFYLRDPFVPTLGPSDVVYVPDLLGQGAAKRSGRTIWMLHGEIVAVLPLQSGGLQLLNLKTSADAEMTRLSEVHYDGRKWSTSRELASDPRWEAYYKQSLAAAVSSVEGRDVVLAVWRTRRDHHLVFTIGTGELWSEPEETGLAVGEYMWLASVGGTRFLFVTRQRGNLFWCWLDLEHRG